MGGSIGTPPIWNEINFRTIQNIVIMKLDPNIDPKAYEAYTRKLQLIIDDPRAYGFDERIIVVCQYLAYFFPEDINDVAFANRTSYGIIDELSGMVDIDVNSICRLMIELGYRVSSLNHSPEWSMRQAMFPDDAEFE